MLSALYETVFLALALLIGVSQWSSKRRLPRKTTGGVLSDLFLGAVFLACGVGSATPMGACGFAALGGLHLWHLSLRFAPRPENGPRTARPPARPPALPGAQKRDDQPR